MNDSVFGEALPLTSCLEYARTVGIERRPNWGSGGQSKPLRESGFYWLGNGDIRILVAAHEVTVPHLSAHAHVHPGHVSLWVDGKRVLTDTGVFEYAAGPRRQRARSVRSHNTVQVGEGEPVRMASSFWLWGTLDPDVEYRGDSYFQMNYDVDTIGCPTYEHERLIERMPDGWKISDKVTSESSSAVSWFHVHPMLEIVLNEERGDAIIEDQKGDPILQLEAIDQTGMTLESAPYYPEYGTERSRPVIKVYQEGLAVCGVRLSYLN